MNLVDRIKRSIRQWLNITPAAPYAININEILDFELSAIRNRIWYRGDSNELFQMYQQGVEYADRYKFWACKSSPGMEIRKIHTGLPGLIVRTLTGIVLNDLNEFEFDEEKHRTLWEEIEADNSFMEELNKALSETLFIGDGAWSISIDTSVSEYPIIEWHPGEKVEYVYNHGRLREVIFKSSLEYNKKSYVLCKHCGYGYITYKLYFDGEEVTTNILEMLKINDYIFDEQVMLAVPFKVYSSSKFEGRGGSIYDGKLDSFDAYDESWSQWMDALRAGRAKTYVPECLIPRDPETGGLLKPNAFDNRFIAAGVDASEGARNQIVTEQPSIPHDSYTATYITALDQCLQGLVSPSTLGIDVKKLDNAEAQREKEKATLYTRDAIIGALQKALPMLIKTAINASNLLHKAAIEDVNVNIPFGEYANPSFESQVETMAKARPGVPLISIEAQVEELYGDSKDSKWKDEEIERLKAEQGIAVVDEPSVAGQDSIEFKPPEEPPEEE